MRSKCSDERRKNGERVGGSANEGQNNCRRKSVLKEGMDRRKNEIRRGRRKEQINKK